MDDEGCKSGSDDELDPGMVCVCVCVCVGVRVGYSSSSGMESIWCVCLCGSTIIRVVARGARGAHYLSIVSPVLKLPTPPYLVTPRDTISTLLACGLFSSLVRLLCVFSGLVRLLCVLFVLCATSAQEKKRE